jgi:hypothetical protein
MGTFEAAEKAAKSKKGEKVVVSTKPTIVATTSKAIIKKTKRQRRKDEQKGEKNKWLIQHPKIQSMEHRQLIYVKDAGLNETKAEKKQLPIDPKLDLMSPEVKFGRMLAGTDQRKRHAAVKKLKAYLKARCEIAEVGPVSGGISELDLLKLWKSLWYTLYMADKKAVQDELSKHVCKLLWCVVGTEEEDECAGRAYLEMIEAEATEDGDGEDDDDDDEYNEVTMKEIENTLEEEKNSESDDDDDVKEDSEESGHGMEDNEEDQEIELDNVNIPHCRGAHLVSLFVRTFFGTIRRDWHTMDKYRVDKFYTLIRTMMHEIYEYMAVRGWNYGIVLLLNDAIFDEILKQPPNGLRYHLIDLCLEELAKVNAKAAIPLTEATFLDVLEPFFGLCQTGTSTHDDTVQSRVMDGVLDNFLENYSIVSEKALPKEDKVDDDGDNKNESCTANIFDQVHVKTVAEFIFALGSDPATSDKYRKSLYDMHKKFMRRVKAVGIDVEIGTEDDDMEGEYNQFLDEEMRDDSEGGCRVHNCSHCVGDTEDEQPAETPVEVEKETKASKKKKKKKKRKSDEMEAAPVATPEKDDAAEVDEKKSKKKKKKTKDVVSPSKSTSADDDEEVVITLTEQQDAKKKDKKAKLQKEQQEDDDDEELNNNSKGSRRVSFGKKNRAKSHKASVKATKLKLETPHSLRELTPVKGILPKEFKYSSNSKTKKNSTKAGRNKATSYF